MKKRLINKVNLVFFQDDATGEYGVTHKETHCSDNSFDAFWDGRGIFHDVFEHWFEKKHKYFMGDNSLNRGGECAAMGAAWYYYDALGIHSRPLGTYHYFGDSIRTENESAIQECIEYGYSGFGNTLECGVPKQKPTDNGELEYQIKKFWENTKKMIPGKDCNSEYNSDEEMDGCKSYMDSVTFKKISSLYRWGYRMAEKMIPDSQTNQRMCIEFIEYFNQLCKNNSAEELSNIFYRLEIYIYKDQDGNITWKGKLISKDNYSYKDAIINPSVNFYMDDYMAAG